MIQVNCPRRKREYSQWTHKPGKSDKRCFEAEGKKHNLSNSWAKTPEAIFFTLGVSSWGEENKGFH